MKEIVNRVAKSKIRTIDLETYFPKEKRVVIDISQWLFEGFILKEKDFRDSLENYAWQDFKNTYVTLTCSNDAIIPSWAYMLVSVYASEFAKKVIIGSLEDLETYIYNDIIEHLDLKDFEDKPVVIKGCSNKPIPQNAYIKLIEKLKPVARKIMYGEACSMVPLYKKSF